MDDQLETAVCRSPTLSLKAAVNYSNCTILQITLDLSFNIWSAKNLQISFVTVVKYTKMAKIFAFSQAHRPDARHLTFSSSIGNVSLGKRAIVNIQVTHYTTITAPSKSATSESPSSSTNAMSHHSSLNNTRRQW